LILEFFASRGVRLNGRELLFGVAANLGIICAEAPSCQWRRSRLSAPSSITACESSAYQLIF